jgi:V8-like Glu-specific endopeptidase
MRRVPTGVAVLLLAVAGLAPVVVSHVPGVRTTSVRAPGTSAVPSPEAGKGTVPAVGALFALGDDGPQEHFCTASVVHSPAGDLLITAAHCVFDPDSGGYRTGFVFAPGFHDGVAPYGYWSPGRITVDPRWAATADPDVDVAFVEVSQRGNPAPVEAVTGANALGTGLGFSGKATVTGYPNDSGDPVSCANTTTRQDAHQVRVDCPGFRDGTSGSPWVTALDPVTHLGTVTGVIGGYQLGGEDPDTSYTSYFDAGIARLYRAATAPA